MSATGFVIAAAIGAGLALAALALGAAAVLVALVARDVVLRVRNATERAATATAADTTTERLDAMDASIAKLRDQIEGAKARGLFNPERRR